MLTFTFLFKFASPYLSLGGVGRASARCQNVQSPVHNPRLQRPVTLPMHFLNLPLVYHLYRAIQLNLSVVGEKVYGAHS